MFLEIKDIKKTPEDPGVYRFFNGNKKLIYVGKAKNLRKRVSSYFNKTTKSPKTLKLVENIRYFDFSIVNNENEAFLLENNLIKENNPLYNILLKDSKAYPYIILTKEPFPRLIVAERLNVDYESFFGPFSDRQMMYDILNFIKSICQLRTCKYFLSEEDIQKKKYKVCLEYHLGNCCGICEKKISSLEYQKKIAIAKNILHGKIGDIKKTFKKQMLQFSKAQEYKKAQKYKEKLEAIENYQSNSIISNPKNNNFDVFYYEEFEDKILICFMIIKNGLIIFIKKDVIDNIVDLKNDIIFHN